MHEDSAPRTAPEARRYSFFSGPSPDPEQALAFVLETIKLLSGTTDPSEMVQIFGERVGGAVPRDHTITLTRRDLDPPKYRIARCSRWENPPDPWTERDKLPVLEGGILGELIFGNEPAILDDHQVGEDDPAYDVLHDIRSYLALPNYDRGEALNMMVMLAHKPGAFDSETLPGILWTTNLFGRAIHNLRVGEELRQAYAAMDAEVKVVSDIQRALLPKELPDIPTLDLAAHYEMAQQAGGDYYDFFSLPDGKWGVLVADVCGHGPAAAVLMGITHAILHTMPTPPENPAETLDYVNRSLLDHYTAESRSFVTAFYGVYDPASRTLTYSSAGHPPPRVRRVGKSEIVVLADTGNMPLGVSADRPFTARQFILEPQDQMVLFTDGITEAHDPGGQVFGEGGLDGVLLEDWSDSDDLLGGILEAVGRFTGGARPRDDRTLLILTVS